MLQVELAQYEYRLPRLTRLWTHLARQAGGRAGGAAGGVGVRGPGETQLEIDRRDIRRRIKVLKEQINDLSRQRKLYRRRRRRSGLPVVALVGYTNAGKSTLLNRLTDADVYVADQLFATLDPTTRRVPLPSGRVALFTDTVGFMQKLPTELVAAFRATLEEISEADLLLHVVDVNHPDVVQQAETVERVLSDMDLTDRPMVVAANKMDRLPSHEAEAPTESEGAADPSVADPREANDATAVLEAIRDVYGEVVPISALRGQGLDSLLESIDVELQRQLVAITARLPYSEGELQNLIHTHGVIESEDYQESGWFVSGLVPAYLLGSVEPYLLDDQGTDDSSSGVGDAEPGVGEVGSGLGSPDVGVVEGSGSGQSR
jgi:GTP-binding protein HflX